MHFFSPQFEMAAASGSGQRILSSVSGCDIEVKDMGQTPLLMEGSLKSSFTLSKIELDIPSLPAEFLELNFISDVSEFDLYPHEQLNTSIVQNNCPFPFANGPIFHSPIIDAILLTDGDDVKNIVEISLDLTGSGIEFQPGDTIGIIPSNSALEVDKVLSRLDIVQDSDKRFVLQLKQATLKKKASIPPHIPINATIRHVLETCLDIRCIPKKLFLRLLSEYTSDSVERRRLHELCSRQGAKEYSQFILEARITLLDILEVFPSCQPPMERLFEFLPRLQARPYSIASSPLAGMKVNILFSLIEHTAQNLTQACRGVCTDWLCSISNPTPHTKSLTQQLAGLTLEKIPPCRALIPLFLRKNNGFCLPKDPSIPLILIGPGTGVAPFIGFLQHRTYELENSEALSFGDIWLFYGCRYSDKDFIFEAHINEFLKSRVLSRFFVAFSRENKNGQVKYVQDNIRCHSKEFVTQLLEKKSTIFVCGDAKNMAKDIWESIAEVLQKERCMTEDEAYRLLNDLKSEQRYLQDIWV